MSKVQMGPKTWMYPMPALLVGANVSGKPNFMTVAWAGIVNGEPPMLAVAIRPSRYTYQGIIQNHTYSVNIPSQELLQAADYCGIVSGAREDKVSRCGFQVFYGKQETAPMIEQCPLNLECRVVNTLTLGSHTLFVGQVEETHVSEECITNGLPDAAKVKPVIFTMDASRQYLSFGHPLGRSFSIGKEIKDR